MASTFDVCWERGDRSGGAKPKTARRSVEGVSSTANGRAAARDRLCPAGLEWDRAGTGTE